MDRSKHYCNNCGNIGHLYRDCRHPILSYGIILYDDSIKEDVKIIMIERKDSISYIEFLRGKYIPHLIVLLVIVLAILYWKKRSSDIPPF